MFLLFTYLRYELTVLKSCGRQKKIRMGTKESILMGKLMAKSTSCIISTFQSLCFVKTCEISMSKGFRAFKRQRLHFLLITKFPILFFQKCSGHHKEKWIHFESVNFYQWQRSGGLELGAIRGSPSGFHQSKLPTKNSDLSAIVRVRAERGVQDREVSWQIIHLMQKVQETKERCKQSPVKAKAERISPTGKLRVTSWRRGTGREMRMMRMMIIMSTQHYWGLPCARH